MHDLARSRHGLDPHELHPFDVADDSNVHHGILTPGRRAALQDCVVELPPFERFYEQHRDEVYGFLVRRLGRDRADDAFQETFLRALRAYPKLRHADHLRAWAFTIAGRIVIDEHRRTHATVELPELPAEDGRPAFAELEHLAEDLPPTERAAVILRYGYDLDYADIGAALGSNASAARQAASAGVRRLRKKELT
ncbi:MAG: sigma-70 family RNA polymerase sigma factor [Actinobacteria bacterium]|nr:MAG: sigma-70 family RNA polymerase sigma factor [Actinomycetota bacterium]